MNWLNDLLDEYSTKRSDAAIARLMRVFDDVPDHIMQLAVDGYMRHGKFFPKIADLRPFVDQALEDDRGDKPYGEIDQQIKWSDDDMMKWEIERGTMEPLAVIEAEVHMARQELNNQSIAGLIGAAREAIR